MSVVDAIGLRSVHASLNAAAQQDARQAPPTRGKPDTAPDSLRAELARVRTVLIQSIRGRHGRHQPDPQDLDTERVICLQAYQDQQRRMALSVEALREHARQTLAQGTPEQGRLAALDAAMEQMLGEREQRLLGELPVFLKARWAARQHGASPDGQGALQLLQAFSSELEQTLLAELEHRLQPVVGLIESLDA